MTMMMMTTGTMRMKATRTRICFAQVYHFWAECWSGRASLPNAAHSFRILLQSHLLRAWNTTWSRALDNNATLVLAKFMFWLNKLAEKRRVFSLFLVLVWALSVYNVHFAQMVTVVVDVTHVLLLLLLCVFFYKVTPKMLIPIVWAPHRAIKFNTHFQHT